MLAAPMIVLGLSSAGQTAQARRWLNYKQLSIVQTAIPVAALSQTVGI